MSIENRKIQNLRMPELVYDPSGDVVRFNQLAVKIEMDHVSNHDYFLWLDQAKQEIGDLVLGAEIAEKASARVSPPLNTAVYYDTEDYSILPTGALLRTSCNKITHAFCAFKDAEDDYGVRKDRRYVFSGEKKHLIQNAPDSAAAIGVVKELLARKDIEHPGVHLQRALGIDPTSLFPALALASNRFTFYVWLDKRDALRCSLDRYEVWGLRPLTEKEGRIPLSEVELAVYPRISTEISQDNRGVHLIEVLRDRLLRKFGGPVTHEIKYQRAARSLGISF